MHVYHGEIFLLFSQHEMIYSSVCGCFRLGIPVHIADLVTWSKSTSEYYKKYFIMSLRHHFFHATEDMDEFWMQYSQKFLL